MDPNSTGAIGTCSPSSKSSSPSPSTPSPASPYSPPRNNNLNIDKKRHPSGWTPINNGSVTWLHWDPAFASAPPPAAPTSKKKPQRRRALPRQGQAPTRPRRRPRKSTSNEQILFSRMNTAEEGMPNPRGPCDRCKALNKSCRVFTAGGHTRCNHCTKSKLGGAKCNLKPQAEPPAGAPGAQDTSAVS